MSKQTKKLRELVEQNLIPSSISFEQIKPYTILELYARLDGVTYRGAGMAICGEGDEWQEGFDSLGFKAAYGRAIKAIGETLVDEEREANAETEIIHGAVEFLRGLGYTVS
jgi:hypothetical protein